MRPLIVAAPASGHGKTSVALGLMTLLRRQGYSVAPFKVGPDFIDPGHHARVCGRPSNNLDSWMCSREHVRQAYTHGCHAADVAIIEGVMGLFDGAAGDDDTGSTAEIARLLNGRILLVVDARAQARSAAALVKGFVEFSPGLDVAGVIFNRVGSDSHAALLNEAMASVPGLPPVLACLPRDETVALPERHLGLVTADETAVESVYGRMADWLAANLDMSQFEALVTDGKGAGCVSTARPAGRQPGKVRLGVARDAAFCFYYPENLELLERAGAELVFFSPLVERQLPVNLQGLYLGGGYPELQVEKLANNRELLDDLRQAATDGLAIYAECGGLMLLADAIDGRPMAGVLAGEARMLPRRKALGYREVKFTADCPLGPAGTLVRGHEFHYSEMKTAEKVGRCYALRDRRGRSLGAEGFHSGRVLGSYVHLHFGSNPQVAENFVRFCCHR